MIVCHCRAVSDRAIRDAVRGGALDGSAVIGVTGAGSCCGGCLPAVESIVRTELGEACSEPDASVRSSRPLRVVERPDRAA